MLTITSVTNESEELRIIRELFREYATELNEDLCFQSFGEELANPLKKYAAPAGSLLLAYWKGEPAACIALQPLREKQTGEMKRLYVRPAFRSHGIGRELVQALLLEAKIKGYKKVVLDTLERLQPAIKLYLQFGFVNTSAYYKNPLPSVVYMEKLLQE